MFAKMRRGFTLLEMMLVIIIVAAIVAFVTSSYKKQASEAQADKTAIEMRALAIAAQRYYDAHDYWPNSINDLTASSSAYQLNVCGSLLLTSKNATCGNYNNYTLSFPANYGSGSPSMRSLPKAGVVYIGTTAPNNDVAETIASKLPASHVNYNTQQVQSATPALTIPSGNNESDLSLDDLMKSQKMIMVKSIYTDLIGKDIIRTGKKLADNLGDKSNFLTVQLPKCPTNWTPGYDVALNQYYALKSPVITSTDFVAICKETYQFNPNQMGTTRFTISGKRTQGSAYHAGSVLIMTYCVPPTLGTAEQKNLAERFTGFNDSKSGRSGGFGNDARKCYFANFKNTNGY